MARFAVPVLVLVALVGGYVVGQQPPPANTSAPKTVGEPEKGPEQEIGGSQPHYYQWSGGAIDVGKVQLTGHASPVGRYVPFQVGLMIDTTNGTLYAMEGNPTPWKVVARFPEATQSNVVAPPTRTNP